MDLAIEVYRETSQFPRDERYSLTQQVRRAAVSVPSNIAEGKGRKSRKEFQQILFHARGSLLELQTQVMIAQRLNYHGTSITSFLGSRSSDWAKSDWANQFSV